MPACALRGFALCATLLAAPLLAVSAAGAADEAPPAIYKWVDEHGIAHYTTDRDRIPKAIRDRVIERTPARTEVAPPAAQEDVLREVAPATAAPPAPPPGATVTAPAPVESAPVEAPGQAAYPPAVDGAFETDAGDPLDPVSAPPPAAAAATAALDPARAAEAAELDEQIETLEGEIATQEEQLATLISTADAQRATPLIDDPQFREISQRLPKLQADLQTLRERRAQIQPAAPAP